MALALAWAEQETGQPSQLTSATALWSLIAGKENKAASEARDEALNARVDVTEAANLPALTNLSALTVPVGLDRIYVNGTVGPNGFSATWWRRVGAVAPVHGAGIQDAAGVWWEPDERVVTPEMFATTAMTYVQAPYGAAEVAAASDWSPVFARMFAFSKATRIPMVANARVYKLLSKQLIDYAADFSGTGGISWYQRGTLPSSLLLQGTVLLYDGNAAKDCYAYGITDCRTSGGKLVNPDAAMADAANASHYTLESYQNEDASAVTGEGATPRAFSAAFEIAAGTIGVRMRDFAMLLSNDGVARYDSKADGPSTASWDTAIFLNGAAESRFDRVNVMGYWRSAVVQRANADKRQIAANKYASAERNIFTECYLQGRYTVQIRGPDIDRVRDVGTNWIEVAWADNHPYHRPGVLPGDIGSGVALGEVTLGAEYRIADLAKVNVGGEDRLRITFTADLSGVVVGSFCQSAFYGAGLAGARFIRCLGVGLSHQNGRRSTDPLNNMGYSCVIQVSGARLRGFEWQDGRINPIDEGAYQVHTCYNTKITGEIEGKTLPSGKAGCRGIASPNHNSNTRTGVVAAGYGTDDFVVQLKQSLNFDGTPEVTATLPSAFANQGFNEASGFQTIGEEDKNYYPIWGKRGLQMSSSYGAFRHRMASDGSIRLDVDLTRSGAYVQILNIDPSAGLFGYNGLSITKATGALAPVFESADSFIRHDYISYRDSTGSRGTIAFKGARGTKSSPAYLTTNDLIGAINAYPWDGSSFTQQGDFAFYTTSAHSVSDRGVYAALALTASGSTAKQTVLTFRANGTAISAAGALVPSVTNTYDIGSASLLWANIRANNGAIVTSDERHKVWRGSLTDAEIRAGVRIAQEIGIFQWAAKVEVEGDAARWHTGVRAQQVKAILEEEGLEWARYAWMCHDSWEAQPEVTQPVMDTRAVRKPKAVQYVVVVGQDETGEDILEPREGEIEVDDEEQFDTGEVTVVQPAMEAGDRYAIRTDQLALFVAAAMETRMSTFEARLAALEVAAN